MNIFFICRFEHYSVKSVYRIKRLAHEQATTMWPMRSRFSNDLGREWLQFSTPHAFSIHQFPLSCPFMTYVRKIMVVMCNDVDSSDFSSNIYWSTYRVMMLPSTWTHDQDMSIDRFVWMKFPACFSLRHVLLITFDTSILIVHWNLSDTNGDSSPTVCNVKEYYW